MYMGMLLWENLPPSRLKKLNSMRSSSVLTSMRAIAEPRNMYVVVTLPIRWSGTWISGCMVWTSVCGGICWTLRSACCVSRCLLRSTFRWKARPHRSHAKGLKPVCLREWVIRFELWLNALPQTWHLWGFSPVDKMYQSVLYSWL